MALCGMDQSCVGHSLGQPSVGTPPHLAKRIYGLRRSALYEAGRAEQTAGPLGQAWRCENETGFPYVNRRRRLEGH